MTPAHRDEILRRLCPELRALLEAELAAGNTIVDAGPGLHGRDSVLVLLANPLSAAPPSSVEHRVIDDPHWWQAEYVHAASGHILACRA